ncbi:MAG TPA: DsbA family protein [Burkholderiaceae bacterium]|jgi:predicted DsbA family dithiol-disulfide isomerase
MKLKIDYVADLGSGWCALNLHSLREALAQLPEIDVELDIRPFEQHPDLPPDGVDIREYFIETYGADMALATQTRDAMREWARELDFDFRPDLRTRAYNSFDGHRLLRWALAQPGPQVQQDLALALFDLTFNRGGNVSDPAQLLQCVEALGLDVTWAGQVLKTDAFADDVHELEAAFREQGVDMLPALYVNGRLISQGSQTPSTYMTLLRVAACLA